MTAPRPLCAWCGEPLGRRAPKDKGTASIEASWHARGLGVPEVGWHAGGPTAEDPTAGVPPRAHSCFILDPLAKAHHEAAEIDVEGFLAKIDARGPGRVVRRFTRARRPT